MWRMKVDTRLERCVQTLVGDYNKGHFDPILESDIVGYLYHLWISLFGSPDTVHLNTRLCESLKRKFDFVVGNVNIEESRPCVKNPELVVEVKVFPRGMSSPQHREHWRKVVEKDIPKLAKLRTSLKKRYLLLFDEADYLKGQYRASKMSKMDYIKKVRENEDEKIFIINMRKKESLFWEFF